MQGEMRDALPWLAIAVPIGTVSAVGVAALEARERFLTLNTMQVLVTASIQLLPLLVAWQRGPALDGLIAVTVICRIGANIPLFFACRRYVPLQARPCFRKSLTGPLFRYGGWVTITGVISPILVSADQFVIGSQSGLSAVTCYTVPYNFVTSFRFCLRAWYARCSRAFRCSLGKSVCRLPSRPSVPWLRSFYR